METPEIGCIALPANGTGHPISRWERIGERLLWVLWGPLTPVSAFFVLRRGR